MRLTSSAWWTSRSIIAAATDYQEGPGFLFVATEGGRPSGPSERDRRAETVRRRRRALWRRAESESLESICADMGVSRTTLFRRRTRFEAGGIAALLDEPRTGRASELPAAIERLVLTVRVLPFWNSRRIAAELTRREVWPIGHGQVDRLLARAGTNRTSEPRVPGPRWEREHPNELWHIDLKGPFFLHGASGAIGTCHFVALVDDHSPTSAPERGSSRTVGVFGDRVARRPAVSSGSSVPHSRGRGCGRSRACGA